MSAARWILRAALVVLAAVFAVQAVQLAAALDYLRGAEALAVSPVLMAALAFKGLLLLINLAMALAVHFALRRLRAASSQPDSSHASPTNGASP